MSEFWSWRLHEVPELASSVGVHDFDDRLETFTLEAFRKRKVGAERTFPSDDVREPNTLVKFALSQ